MANQKSGASKQLHLAQTAQAEAIFNSIGDGAISTDEYGRITRVNPVAQRLLQYSESELVGEWFPKKIVALNEDGQPLNLIERPITRAFLTGKNISEKLLYKTKKGSHLPVAVSVSPILLNGKPIGAIEVFHDVTLENEVDRMKSEFISLASHQLRTPLSAIKTYSHMLLDGYMGELNSAQRKSLRTIISASNRMNELISTLLNITRIESGTIAVTPKTLYVDKLAEEVTRELSLAANEKGIALTLTQIGKLPTTAKTDTLIIKEVITNLVSNAIKYTPDNGSVAIEVKGRTKDVLVCVRDTGWGIPEFAQNQIFSKFFRANNIVQRETTGTGLGLYLVKGLLEKVEGSIWFESVEGEGTCFSFTIPRHLKPVRQPSTKLMAEESSSSL
jgi:PAS domain S-box-containing protein